MATTTMTETIKAATIARVTDKLTGKFLGFLVKSNHTEDYYHVTCTKIAHEVIWHCTCKAGQFGRVCCHVKACKELCAIRKAARAAEAEQKRAVAEAERHLQEKHAAQKRAAFERICSDIRAMEAHWQAEKRYQELLRQRDEARRIGGFSLLAA